MISSTSNDTAASTSDSPAQSASGYVTGEILNAVLAQLKEGIIVTDASGCIVFVNDAAKRLHGVARLDVAPAEYSATYHLFTEAGEPHPVEELPLTRAVQRGETVVGQRWRIRRPDGSEVLAIGDATPVRDPGGAQIGAVLTVRDDTRRHAAEKSVKDNEQRLQQILDQLFVFVGQLSPEGVVLASNRAPLDIAGLTFDDVRGKRFEDCYWWSYDPHVQAQLRDAIDRAAFGERVRYVVAVRAAGGRLVRIDFQIAPIFDTTGRVASLVASGIDIDDRLIAERDLRDAEVRFRTMADNIAQLAWMAQADGPIFWYNKRWYDYTGTTPATMLGWGWRDVHHPEHVGRVVDSFNASLVSGEPWEDTFPLRGADGAYRWFLSRALPIRDETGAIVMWFGTNTDVTDLRDALDHQKFLMMELSHRTKNLLAVIQSISRQTGLNSASIEDFSQRFVPRLAALASSHDLLVNQDWSGVDLTELIREQLKPFMGDDMHRAALSGPPLSVTPATAQALGLALHELSTNAAKYGALSTPSGVIDVTWGVYTATGDVPRFRLTWIERNGPPVVSPKRNGFGHVVIEQVVASSLLGASKLSFKPGGVEWELDAPRSCLVNAKPAVVEKLG